MCPGRAGSLFGMLAETDTIQVPTGAGSATIDLRAATLEEGEGAGGYVSWVSGIAGGFTIANGVVIENAIGGQATTNSSGMRYNKLTGGGGQDILTGRDGADIFIFTDLTAQPLGRSATRSRTSRPMTQSTSLGSTPNRAIGNQDFHWIDGASFTGNEGDLRFSNSTLAGDVNGDPKADFVFR